MGLSPGTYRLSVRAIGAAGGAGEPGTAEWTVASAFGDASGTATHADLAPTTVMPSAVTESGWRGIFRINRDLTHEIFYYSAGVDDLSAIQPIPAGLKMVTGSMMSAPGSPQDSSVVRWHCQSWNSSDGANRPASPKGGMVLPWGHAATIGGRASMVECIHPGRSPFMLVTLLVIAVVIALIALYGIKIYNDLVRFRQMVKEGWSGISVQLKRRFDLVPNMVEAVKGYLKHEREVLENVTQARSQAQAAGDGPSPERSRAEGMLGAALGRLFAVVENYPELKANANVMDLQRTLDELEDQIQLSRRYYNGAVRQLNTTIEQFPTNIVANMFHFESAEFFEVDDSAERIAPKVSLS